VNDDQALTQLHSATVAERDSVRERLEQLHDEAGTNDLTALRAHWDELEKQAAENADELQRLQEIAHEREMASASISCVSCEL